MSNPPEDEKPYRYVRVFVPTVEQKPPEGMDEEILQAYINKLLGTKGKIDRTD